MSSFNGIVQGWLGLAKAGAEATLYRDPDKGQRYLEIAKDICVAAGRGFPGWIFDERRLKVKGTPMSKLGLYKYYLDGEEKSLPELESILTVDPTPYFCKKIEAKIGELVIKEHIVKRVYR